MPRKLGLLGGTFDPVHRGHIQLAMAALTECELDQVIFLPAAQPPHKATESVTSFNDRLAMLELVCSSCAQFSISTIEKELPRPSYTINTLRSLNAENIEKNVYSFIIGSDAFLELHTWRAFQELFDMINLIIARREGDALADIEAQCQRLGFTRRDRQNKWEMPHGSKEAVLLSIVPMNCSATQIKKDLKVGAVSRLCLTDEVANYIIQHDLYQESRCSGKAGECLPDSAT